MPKPPISKQLCLLTLPLFLSLLSLSLPTLGGEQPSTDSGAPLTADSTSQQADLKALQAALTPDSQNPGKLRKAAIELHQQQRTEQALEKLQLALQAAPEQTATHYALGVVHLARASEVGVFGVRKNLSAAIDHFATTIELDPQHTAAHYYLIQVLINAPNIVGGDQARGEALNETLATLSPLHHQLVQATLARQAENFDRAEQLLLAANQQHPNQSLVYYGLSDLYLATGQYQQAIDYAEQFLAQPKAWDDTSDLMGLHLLARAHAGAGQFDQSQHYYQQALEQTQNPRFSKRLQEELAELQTTDKTASES